MTFILGAGNLYRILGYLVGVILNLRTRRTLFDFKAKVSWAKIEIPVILAIGWLRVTFQIDTIVLFSVKVKSPDFSLFATI